MSALLDADEPIALVVASRADAYGLTRARRKGVETLVLDKKIDWTLLLETLHARKITHIFLTGFMKVVPAEFLKSWAKPILNVHPSLLPAYPGLKSLERARADRAAIGATVHQVVADVDAGPTVVQKTIWRVGEYDGVSPENLEFSLHAGEYELVRRAVKVASCWT